jgi:hypothetical protein
MHIFYQGENDCGLRDNEISPNIFWVIQLFFDLVKKNAFENVFSQLIFEQNREK